MFLTIKHNFEAIFKFSLFATYVSPTYALEQDYQMWGDGETPHIIENFSARFACVDIYDSFHK